MPHDSFAAQPNTQPDAQPMPDAEAPFTLPAPQPQRAWGDDDGAPHGHPGASDGAAARHPWRAELTRWLLTLNPGRTQTEYEKGVRLFFETPGAPADLGDLNFDLLLAYRGALAMRAVRPQDAPRSMRSGGRSGPLGAARLGDARRGALPGFTTHGDDASAGDAAQSPNMPTTPLAPATVNIRLTALRQFLIFASLANALAPDLTPDRIRVALRRLTIERRRPYQALAQREWPSFLAAARAPAEAPPDPWGVTRAARLHAREQAASESRVSPAQTPSGKLRAPRRGANSGALTSPPRRNQRTGARTAQRDHALLALALATGLRAIELSSLDVGDLSREWHDGEEEWWLILPDAKTKGQRGGRTLPLAPTLVDTLLDYLGATGRDFGSRRDRATPLFLANTPDLRRLSPQQIRGVVDRVEGQWQARMDEAVTETDGGVAAGGGRRRRGVGDARRISPHALRHSAALALLEGDEATGRPPASVEHVRGWLGHFDIRTTQGYLSHLDDRKHRRRFAITPGEAPQTQPHAPQGKSPHGTHREENA